MSGSDAARRRREMRKLRPLALFACIAATTAFGTQMAAAATSPKEQSEAKCSEQYRHQGHRHNFLKKLAKELGMSDQQKSAAWALLKKDRGENKPLFTAMMTERRQLRKLVMSGSAEEAAIRAQSAKIASIQSDLAVRRAQQTKQLLALLTPDQVGKLQSILAKHEAKREQKFRKFAPAENEGM
jgi:periplasmic protein CpxP/Spy